MKKFSNYISEKLVINKNFKSYCDPNKFGRALIISYPCSADVNQFKRLDLAAVSYSYDSKMIKTYVVNFKEISDEGIFYKIEPNWAFFIFFETDAINILNIVKENPGKIFKLSEYVPSLKHIIKRDYFPLTLKTSGNGPQPYSEEYLEEMINFIIKDNEI